MNKDATGRNIPDPGEFFHPYRVMFDKKGTFVDCWQHIYGGQHVNYVDKDLNPIVLENPYTAMPLQGGHNVQNFWLPEVVNDPDPEGTRAFRAKQQEELEASRRAPVVDSNGNIVQPALP